jgi:hypothetical protein
MTSDGLTEVLRGHLLKALRMADVTAKIRTENSQITIRKRYRNASHGAVINSSCTQ